MDALYQKYRPKTLDEVVGNRPVVESLSALVKEKSIPHAILLTGASGCGKTTIARIIKDALKCGDMDYREVDSADFRGIDTVRDIRKHMMLKPIDGDCRVWLLDEIHQATRDAMSALLKALEDTPSHVYFILATTDPQKLLPTIRNRCMTFELKPLSNRLMERLIKSIARKEGKEINDEVVASIIKESLGSPRAALVVLQKVIDLEKEQQAKAIEQQVSTETQVIDLCRVLMTKGASWKKIKEILKGLQDGQEPETVRRAVLGYCTSVLLSEDNPLAYLVMDSFRTPTYDSGWSNIVMACYEICEENQKK